MKKEKSIQADIEVLKKMFTNPYFEGEQYSAITSAISALEAMRDKPEMKSAGRTVCKKCNEIFQPILNKALKENKELKAKIKEKENG